MGRIITQGDGSRIEFGQEAKVLQAVYSRRSKETRSDGKANSKGSAPDIDQSLWIKFWSAIVRTRPMGTAKFIEVELSDVPAKKISSDIKVATDLERFREELERKIVEEKKDHQNLDEKFNKIFVKTKKKK